jgi:hypothetical protein
MVYNPYFIRLIYLNQITPEKKLEKDQTTQKTKETFPSRSQKIFFLPRKKNRY